MRICRQHAKYCQMCKVLPIKLWFGIFDLFSNLQRCSNSDMHSNPKDEVTVGSIRRSECTRHLKTIGDSWLFKLLLFRSAPDGDPTWKTDGSLLCGSGDHGWPGLGASQGQTEPGLALRGGVCIGAARDAVGHLAGQHERLPGAPHSASRGRRGETARPSLRVLQGRDHRVLQR